MALSAQKNRSIDYPSCFLKDLAHSSSVLCSIPKSKFTTIYPAVAMTNNVVMNILVHISLGSMQGSSGRHCELELLGQSISSMLVLNDITKLNGFIIHFVNINLCLLNN